MLLALVYLALAPHHALSLECTFKDPSHTVDRAGSFNNELWYWPGHVIYYRWDSSVIKEDREIIREVMAEIEDNTCVTFVETRQPRFKLVRISTTQRYDCVYCHYLGLLCPLTNGGEVRSNPGCTKDFTCPYYRGHVVMSLTFRLPFCGRLSQRWKALIMHELLHVLGLIHTQNRPDRDRHIWINEHAIQSRRMSQYMPVCRDCQTYNLPYECDSIMHYGWMDFASIGRVFAFLQPTMTAKHSHCRLTSDGGSKPTRVDWEMANRAQRCELQVP